MVKRLIFIFTIALSIHSNAQTAAADSVMQVVLEALTLEEHTVNGNVDSLLQKGSWEALAYWDMSDPKTVESLQEAVGDRYAFSGTEFIIQFIDPNNPRQIGLTVEGYFQRKGNFIELYKTETGPRQKLEIWYIDERYMVIESDGLRIFLTHENSYYLID